MTEKIYLETFEKCLEPDSFPLLLVTKPNTDFLLC